MMHLAILIAILILIAGCAALLGCCILLAIAFKDVVMAIVRNTPIS